jgi:hypothetical protein
MKIRIYKAEESSVFPNEYIRYIEYCGHTPLYLLRHNLITDHTYLPDGSNRSKRKARRMIATTIRLLSGSRCTSRF